MLDELLSFVMGLFLVVVIVKMTDLNCRQVQVIDKEET